MQQHYIQVMEMHQVIQLHGEVDIPRYEDHGGRSGVRVSEPAETLTELVVSCVLSNGIHMHQSNLKRNKNLYL